MSIAPLLLNNHLNGSWRLDWQVCLPCPLRISLHCFQASWGIFILFLLGIQYVFIIWQLIFFSNSKKFLVILSFSIWIHTSIQGRPGVLISYRRFLVGWLSALARWQRFFRSLFTLGVAFSLLWLHGEHTFRSQPCIGPCVSSLLWLHPTITAVALMRVSGRGFTGGHGTSTSSQFWISRCAQPKLPLMPGLLVRLPSFPGSWASNALLLFQFSKFFKQMILYFVQTHNPH